MCMGYTFAYIISLSSTGIILEITTVSLAMLQTVYTVWLGKIRRLVSFVFAIHLVVERLIGSHVRRVTELPARDQIHREESRIETEISNVNKNVCVRMYTRYIRTWEENVRTGS